MTHDAERQLQYLRDSLSHDQKPLGFFLGAGCPTSIRIAGADENTTKPLIPDIRGLTEALPSALENGSHDDFMAICEQLDADGKKQPNVEDILSHTRALAAVAGSGEVRGFTFEKLVHLDQAISKEISSIVDRTLPDEQNGYSLLATWTGAVNRKEPVQFFTTNYDVLLEQALERQRVPYFDGFCGAYEPFLDPASMDAEETLPARWARVWKLHGSISWFHNESRIFRSYGRELGHATIIHPSHLKYEDSRRMPYLAMIDRLKSFLKKSSSLLIISGYSFGDDHLNEVILDGLAGNPTAAAFGLMYGQMKAHPKSVELAQKRSNLSLLAEDMAIISTMLSQWDGAIPNLGDFSALGTFLAETTGQSRLRMDR